MRKMFMVVVLLFPLIGACGESEAATEAVAAELAIGATAPGFKLTNAVDGKSLAFEPGDGKISVVVFTCNQCPYAKAFQSRLNAIAGEYGAKGVTFYAVNPNDAEKYEEESLENMKIRAVSNQYPFPYLKDGDSSVARAYGARVTPHVFVVDGKGALRYRGFIDDSAKPEKRTKTGLTNALDSLLASAQVAETVTREFGCSIKWKI